jgi:hypothetical protein
LFVQRVQFLLGKLTFAFGFLERREHAVEVAHDGLEAVANAIDLAAQDAIGITVALVAAVTAATVSIATSVATATIITTVASTTFNARTIAIIATRRRFTVGLSASFEKFVSLMRLVRRHFGNAFAFRRFINGWGNIFVFVTRAVFAFAIIIVFWRTRSFAIRGLFRGITFARGAVVIATSAAATARSAATAAAHGTTSAPAATAAAAFAITAVAAFGAGTIWTCAGRADGAFSGLRFRVSLFGSGRRGGRGFPSFERGLSRRFGGAFRAS